MDSRDDRTVLIDSQEVLSKMKAEARRKAIQEREAALAREREQEDTEFYDEDDGFFDEEDPEDVEYQDVHSKKAMKNGYSDEGNEYFDEEDDSDLQGNEDTEGNAEEEDEDFRFVDDDFTSTRGRRSAMDMMSIGVTAPSEAKEKEIKVSPFRKREETAAKESEDQEYFDDFDDADDVSASEGRNPSDETEYLDDAGDFDAAERLRDFDDSKESEEFYDSDDEEACDTEDVEAEDTEEVDEDATVYIDPEQVKLARVEGYVTETSEETEPDLDSMSKKERKKYLKQQKKQQKAQKKDTVVSSENGKKNQGSNSSETDSEKKPKTWVKVLKIILFSILGLILAAYIAGAVYFYTHFGPNSVVNDMDVSYMNVQQVQSLIRDQVAGYSLHIVERNDASETIKGTDVDLEYVPDSQVADILHAQNCFIWPYRVLADVQAEEAFTHASVQMNEEKFRSVVEALNCSDPEQMIAPANAYPFLDGNIYAPHPEEEGTTIKPDVLKTVLEEAILSTSESVDLSENGCYTEPEIRADDPEINRICEKKNELIGLSITYHFGDEVDVLDGATTDAWITWDEDLNPTIDQEAIKAWAVEFGKTHDTVGKARTFVGAAGREVTVSGGSYGWSVDEEQEIAMVNQMFEERQSQDREPIWATTAASHGDLDWGDTYIEVDIATQHMWYFKDGELIFENDVVTGLPTAARQTTPGVWSILEMMRNKTLRGDRAPDGTYEYETPVAYWMRITWTGIGFHDATWQPSFGGNRYTYAGSHGCINMSYSGAQTLYSIAFVGCPVIVHQ